MPDVSVDHVSVRRGGELVLDDVSFTAAAGEITVVIGPSGSGKTSLLRAIARLDPLLHGSVWFGDRDVTNLPPGAGGASLAFQDSTLLGHRDVAGNVGFPLELQRVLVDEIRTRVGDKARSLHIESLLERRPAELSAGEAQMVQIARALIRAPDVILLDEPFGAIEGDRAMALRREIRHLQQWFGATVLAATNDPDDARRFADAVVVLDGGRLVQVGPARQVFDQPDTAVAAQLTGDATIDVVTVELADSGCRLVHPAFRVRAWAPVLREHVGRRIQLVTRPEWWELDENGTVAGVVTRGPRWSGDATLTIQVGEHDIAVRIPPRDAREVHSGDAVRLRLAHWVTLDPLTGRRIDTGR